MIRGQKTNKQTFQQEPRGRFSVQLLWTENRHVPDRLYIMWLAFNTTCQELIWTCCNLPRGKA